ncbi:C4-type zinc ribbon domain-containing protein [Clostridium grantii]|uniref:C4-type zinc ribbon domain-containing protein n=1 Tax=Clostridium grantii DSM 8605 TaxID=1121316 RepID=A0A1M5QD60_9CLOT|nr:C4-type zinc ribbon domain-containing protein [Clostridium grantii]SHH11972.1 hypothetical protein SAMN02745207_00011 [Clostridium grantii DSM 8605]
MKKEFELLVEFDENKKILKENLKILEDKTVYEILKEVKKSYEKNKEEYNLLVKQLKETSELCENISKEIEGVEEELNEKEDILLNHCGSDIHKIKNTENIIGTLKEKVNLINKELDTNLNEENNYKQEIKIISKELTKLKEKFFDLKKKLNEKVQIANKNIEGSTKRISLLQDKIPEEILEIYFETRKKRKEPIAKLREHTCLGCKLGISAVTLDECKKGNKIILCDNCGRIIFLDK